MRETYTVNIPLERSDDRSAKAQFPPDFAGHLFDRYQAVIPNDDAPGHNGIVSPAVMLQACYDEWFRISPPLSNSI